MNYLQFKYEYRAISRILEKHHSVFYKMWEYGIPVLTESVPTAAMVWDSKSYNPLEFRFNPKFWESLDIDSKAFIICHECLHAILLHGERGRTLREAQADKVKINVAMDLAINHMLVNSFDFDRDNVSVAKSGCWVDTVFENMDVPTNLSFEEYYYLLEKNNIDVSMYYCDIESILKSLLGEGKLSINIFDDHEALGDINIKELGMNISKILEDDELESLKNDIKAFDCGRNPNLPFVIPKIQRMYPTNKWEKIVNQWKRIGINPPDDAEIWTKPNRRGDSLPTDIILPTYDFTDDEDFCRSKLNAWIFLDVSGSCIHLKEQFFMAYETISPKRFNKKMFVFADKVKEVKTKDATLDGVGGGTDFPEVAEFVHKRIQRTGNTPDLIMMITDGQCNHPDHYVLPERWNWFLDDQNLRNGKESRYASNIPSKHYVHNLHDFFVMKTIRK